MGSHGSLSLLFMMKGIVLCFVSDSHKVMTSLILMLSSSVVENSQYSHRYVFLCDYPSHKQLVVGAMQIMRETLIYLSHLDHEDTEQQVYCFGSLLGLIS
jgi:hypothetical protein